MPIVYKCSICEGEFISTWSKEEAEEEMRTQFGNINSEDRAIVCDDCYKELYLKGDN